MRIRLRERDPQSRHWHTVLDQRVSLSSCTHVAPLDLNEASEVTLQFFPEKTDVWGDLDYTTASYNPWTGVPHMDVRLKIGNMPVASSVEKDRPDFFLRLIDDREDDHEYFGCTGRLLRDWVGQTELTIEARPVRRRRINQPISADENEEQDWRPILHADLNVTAGKLEQEVFEALCAEIADYSAAILLDVYGKTFVGLELERRPGEAAPLMALHRIRLAIEQMESALRDMVRRPAYRLKTVRVREPVVAGQAVSDLTLEETCLDPTLAVPTPTGVRFQEHVREVASPTYDLSENRMISGFLHFLSLQIRDLRRRMESEIQMRLERREYRHRRTTAGGKTWWETEDLPRIDELKSLLTTVEAMGRALADLQRFPFLPAAPPMRNVPQSTPLIRSHKAYSAAFKTMAHHYQAFRVQMDDKHLVMRARSLPVLYEWWCLLEVIRILRGCLDFGQAEDFGPRSPFRRLAEERDRFVVEFTPDQSIDFEDRLGNVLRLRYVPTYVGYFQDPSATYGLLTSESQRTPDVALELFRAGGTVDRPPDLIIVLDAKYSSETHWVKLDEVNRKYGKIGVFKTGRVLSRQVWAMTPAPASSLGVVRQLNAPEWASFCTVDNLGFWSDDFDMESTVAGVVQAKPKMPAGRPPLDSLLRLLLKRFGFVMKT